MKKSQRTIVYALIGLVLLVVALDWFAVIDVIPGFPMQTKGPTPPLTPEQKDDYNNGIGMFNVRMATHDSLAPATTLTHTTNYNLFWYTKRGTQWVYHDTGDNKYVDMTPEDGGNLYVVMEIPSAQNYYVDIDKIELTNSYVTSTQYTDVDGDTVKELAFQYDMKGHSIPSSGYPVIWFHGHCIAYDASFTGLNDLANVTSIGQTTVTKWHLWYLAFSAEAKGIALSKIEFKVTSTDETKVKLKQLEVPGRGFLDASNFVFETTATYYTWTYTYGTTFDTAYYLQLPTGQNNHFNMDTKVEYTLANNDDIQITLTVYYVKPVTEARGSTSDSFYAQE